MGWHTHTDTPEHYKYSRTQCIILCKQGRPDHEAAPECISKPSSNEHLDLLQLPGQQGGLKAFAFDLTQDFMACQLGHDEPPRATPEHYQQAWELLFESKAGSLEAVRLGHLKGG